MPCSPRNIICSRAGYSTFPFVFFASGANARNTLVAFSAISNDTFGNAMPDKSIKLVARPLVCRIIRSMGLQFRRHSYSQFSTLLSSEKSQSIGAAMRTPKSLIARLFSSQSCCKASTSNDSSVFASISFPLIESRVCNILCA